MKYLYLHGLGQNAGSWNKAIEATEVLDHSVCLDLSEMVKGKAATYSTLYSAFVELCDAEMRKSFCVVFPWVECWHLTMR